MNVSILPYLVKYLTMFLFFLMHVNEITLEVEDKKIEFYLKLLTLNQCFNQQSIPRIDHSS